MRRSLWANIDYATIIVWISLVSVGLLAIYSVTHSPASEFLKVSVRDNFWRQLNWFVLCIAAMIVIKLLPVRFCMLLSWPIYGLTILLTIAALFFGREINGATSWLFIGPFGIQSAEFAKVGTVLAVSAILSQRVGEQWDMKRVMLAMGVIILPAIVIVLQNDTGTALVYIALIPVVLFWSGMPMPLVTLMMAPVVIGYLTIVSWPWAIGVAVLITIGVHFSTKDYRLTGAAATIGLVMIPGLHFALNQVLKPHQRGRIAAFADPEAFRLSEGFHVIQSKAAIGSGGFLGKGFMEGTQTQMGLVPEQSTDFVYAVVGEEFGFLGSMIVLALFALLMVRIILGASRIAHPYAHFYAACAVGILFTHVVINLGMTLGAMPVIGIPLPFISYGGSALLANTILISFALNFSMRSHEFPAHGV